MEFFELALSAVTRETPDSVTLEFRIPPALEPQFRFRPGQYLTLRASVDGEDLRRSYSICSLPKAPLRVGIKKVPGGKFSNHAARLRPGDRLLVAPPAGRFVRLHKEKPTHHVGFAAGSGITPILAIVGDVLEKSPEDRVTLFYGNRRIADAMFLEDLHRLKDRFLNRLRLFHVLSRESVDVPLFVGRLDREKVGLLHGARLFDPADCDVVYLCGPGDMIEGLEAGLAELGVPKSAVLAERFGAAASTAAPPPAVEQGVEVEVLLDGMRRRFVAKPGERIIDAGARAGLDLPWSCAGGMCSTCRCRLVEGEAAMTVNYALEPWELERGYLLACQAEPRSPRLVLDFDGQ